MGTVFIGFVCVPFGSQDHFSEYKPVRTNKEPKNTVPNGCLNGVCAGKGQGSFLFICVL